MYALKTHNPTDFVRNEGEGFFLALCLCFDQHNDDIKKQIILFLVCK